MRSIVDWHLYAEYAQSNKEYLRLLVRPLKNVPLLQLIGCSDKDISLAFTEWSVLQVWVSCLTCLAGEVMLFFSYGAADYVDQFVLIVITYTMASYVIGHLGWFVVVKMRFQVPTMTFLWGLLCVLVGSIRLLSAMLPVTPNCKCCIANVVLQGVYAAMVMHMGLTSLVVRREQRRRLGVPPVLHLARSSSSLRLDDIEASVSATNVVCTPPPEPELISILPKLLDLPATSTVGKPTSTTTTKTVKETFKDSVLLSRALQL